MRKITKTVAAKEDIAALKEQNPDLEDSINLAIEVYIPPADEEWVKPEHLREVEVSNHGNVRDETDKVHKVPHQIHGEKLYGVVDNEGKHHLKSPKKLKEEAGFEDD